MRTKGIIKSKVFLSHIHEDKAIAITIAKYLEQAFSRAIEIFVSSDGTSILLGDKWLDRIEENLKSSSILIVLASPNSVPRPWINFEAGGGWIGGARVMPVCIRGMKIAALPQPLKSLQASEIGSPEGVRDFFLGVAKVLDLDCSFADWAEVGKQLERAAELDGPADFAQSTDMPTTWSPDNRDFGWIKSLPDPELFGIASNLLAVRQACHEDS